MRKQWLISIILSISLVISGFAQMSMHRKVPGDFSTKLSTYNTKGDDQAYFWFYVRVKVRTHDNIYKIIAVGSRINSGKLKKFDKAVWRGLAQRKIVIGPFVTKEDAQKAQQLYRIISRAKTRDDLRKAKLPEYNHELYWFAIKFVESPRLRIFIIEHSPARVESGNALNFLNALYETLTYQQILIGPFEDYERTEEIKRIYRRNE